ncbi:hypothetical protein HanIR_Chr15g0739821 [Helianthus annuus]|nr:hypothetical protein HanIR_Chr15g0739821 [Helianthus annuus]
MGDKSFGLFGADWMLTVHLIKWLAQGEQPVIVQTLAAGRGGASPASSPSTLRSNPTCASELLDETYCPDELLFDR